MRADISMYRLIRIVCKLCRRDFVVMANKNIFAECALLPDGVSHNIRVAFSSGRIVAVEKNASARDDDESVRFIAPAMPNLHSHAFQRAMAGRAELRGEGDDSFWSWRSAMYHFAHSMTPDHVEAVAAMLYVEMLEAGFGRVGEFHYLHHRPDGGFYDDPAEMAGRIASASQQTGIGLTLLPVFYAHSGFGGFQPSEGQRRFIHDIDGYGRLLERSKTLLKNLPTSAIGIAPHSLRAVTADQLEALGPMADGGPIHIHVAEQLREVEDCVQWSGQRPVEWLLDHADVNKRWCLIHATHMTESETRRMAQSGAVAGLCPITESNLGDGIFRASSFIKDGGLFGVGSDSNIRVSAAEELRTLEYSQRLELRSRNVLARPGASTGVELYTASLAGGGQALGVQSAIAIGAPADFVSLDLSALPWLKPEQALDQFIFAQNVGVESVWVAGEKLVSQGRHKHRELVETRFTAAMTELCQ